MQSQSLEIGQKKFSKFGQKPLTKFTYPWLLNRESSKLPIPVIMPILYLKWNWLGRLWYVRYSEEFWLHGVSKHGTNRFWWKAILSAMLRTGFQIDSWLAYAHLDTYCVLPFSVAASLVLHKVSPGVTNCPVGRNYPPRRLCRLD